MATGKEKMWQHKKALTFICMFWSSWKLLCALLCMLPRSFSIFACCSLIIASTRFVVCFSAWSSWRTEATCAVNHLVKILYMKVFCQYEAKFKSHHVAGWREQRSLNLIELFDFVVGDGEVLLQSWQQPLSFLCSWVRPCYRLLMTHM